MDPVSISGTCVGLISLIITATTAATRFIRTCRGAREDLTAAIGDLTQLRTTLDLLKDDDTTVIPERMRTEILSLLDKCAIIVIEIEKLIESLGNSRPVPVKWAASEKSKVEAARAKLRGYAESLGLTIDIVGL